MGLIVHRHMSLWRRSLLSALLGSALLGCDRSTGPEVPASPLQLTLAPATPLTRGGMGVFTATVTNAGSTSHAAVFPGSSGYLHILLLATTARGDTVWVTPGYVTLPTASFFLEPGDRLSSQVFWPLTDREGRPVAPDTYRVSATLQVLSNDGQKAGVLRSEAIDVVVTP